MKAGSKRIAKMAYKCKDGPWKGHTLWLAHGQATLVFTYKGQTGRYVQDYSADLVWQEQTQ